ncbi:Acriflavin resistance family protein [Desulfonema limicola]|uniref:Acriflavin resistance family protein n=1 Tax=Desulfonema limicola TaxID=45656 RepID=A0A975B9J6_9BACT|nr:efflux RND transporter permease subunit [Desulfonema limicola]QTA81065.1 Acriflavin resistance family protein [Desulfonema limicola]
MNLSEISIKRPVLATVMSLIILLVGLVAYDRLTVREYPDIDEPVISVNTVYQGASPEIIETEVTKIIEDGISGIEGIKTITSVSRQEQSQITIKFHMERDASNAAADVRDRVGRVRGKLPGDVEEPVIAKVEANSTPIIFMSFYSDKQSSEEITDYLERVIQDRFETISGVSEAMVLGGRTYAMRIWLDPVKMAALKVTVQDVETALSQQNAEIPGGRIESAAREFTILSDTGMNTVKEFRNLILRNQDGYLVKLKDVGRVEIGPKTNRTILRSNGKNAVGIGIVKQSTANPLEISKAVRDIVPEIKKDLPPGMNLDINYDSSVFIENSVNNVFKTIFEAIVLVIIVIFVFLRSVRSTIIPLITIPVSLIGAFAIMWTLGFSINTLTLLALILAVGLVVDDAIVMLENIYRHVEQGMTPFKAAIQGSREIGFAIIAMTLTLVAVYAPVAFMTGRTGKLFTEFALALAGAVLVSGFVALTLSPMMCSLLLKKETNPNILSTALERIFTITESFYRKTLAFSMKLRIIIAGLAVLAAFGTVWLFTHLPSELSPVEDRGAFFSIAIAPDGASIDYTDHYSKQVEAIINEVPERAYSLNVTGRSVVTESMSILMLKPWSERERSQQEIVKSISFPMFNVPGVLAFPINPPSLGQDFISQPVEFIIKTSGTWEELNTLTDKLMAEIRKNPGISAPRTDLKLNSPEIRVSINRDKAADMGISVQTIGNTINTLMSGRELTRFKMDGEQYDVIVKTEDHMRTTPDELNNLFVRAPNGEMVSLSNLVTIKEGVTAQSLNHFGKMRSVTISANLGPGYSQGDALAFLEREAKKILPENAGIDYGGQSREYRESGSSLLTTFFLALAFIYLMLSAQFESFIDPLIIMLTVPLSTLGGMLALYLTGNTMNIYSQMGLITLIGLVTKNGILMVEFANQLREKGMEKAQAILEASVMRLRPVLMTAGTMTLGSLPLALAAGAGAESRQQIGWVIVGGLGLGTFMTLFVVPAAYMIIARKRRKHEPEDIAEPSQTTVSSGAF